MELFAKFYFILSVSGAFAVLDAFLPKDVKKLVSRYVFGEHGLTVSDYETAISHAWIDFFLSGLKLRIVWTFAYLSLIYLLVGVYLLYSGTLTTGPNYYLAQLAAVFILALMSLPYMYINLLIGRFVYYGYFKSFHWLAKYILDLSISVSVLLVFGILADSFAVPIGRALFFISPPWLWLNVPVLMTGLAFSSGVLVGVYFYTRLSIFSFGIVVRFLIKLSKVNFEVALRSSVYDSPLAFLAFISTSFLILFQVIWFYIAL